MSNRTQLSTRLLAPLAFLALGSACTSTKTVAQVSTAPPIAVHVPQITFSPEVWETCGSEIIPSLKMTTPPHNERVTYRFEYEGDGSVQLPDSIILEPGSNQLSVKTPFRTDRVSETAQGIVRVLWSHPTAGEKVVGQWNVVQRPSILREMRVARADDLVSADAWDITFAITVEMDPVEEWVDQTINEHRDVLFEASSGGGDSNPVIEVFSDVSSDSYPSFPREIVPKASHKVFVVCVKRPKLPSKKRPFLMVKARSGGDQVERYLKLPF